MLGVMIKDFYETFCIKKNLIGMVTSVLFLFAFTLFMHNLYSLFLMVYMCLPMIGVSILQYSMEQDEISHYDKMLLTFPVTRKQIVQSKFLSILLFTLFVQLCIALPIVLVFATVFHVITFKTVILIWFIGFLLSFIMNAITSVGFFWLGNKKGTIIYMIFLVVIAIAYICTQLFYGVDIFLSLKLNQIVWIGCFLAVIFNIISYYVCLIIYQRKYS